MTATVWIPPPFFRTGQCVLIERRAKSGTKGLSVLLSFFGKCVGKQQCIPVTALACRLASVGSLFLTQISGINDISFEKHFILHVRLESFLIQPLFCALVVRDIKKLLKDSVRDIAPSCLPRSQYLIPNSTQQCNL